MQHGLPSCGRPQTRGGLILSRDHIISILRWSEDNFGELGGRRYEALPATPWTCIGTWILDSSLPRHHEHPEVPTEHRQLQLGERAGIP